MSGHGNGWRNRWRITGVLKTDTPLHIGDGGEIDTPGLTYKDQDSSGNEVTKQVCVASVAKDIDGKPYIPGSTLKGNLRAWLERNARPNIVEALLGSRDSGKEDAVGGKCEFWNVRVTAQAPTYAADAAPPWWNPSRLTGVRAGVAINRVAGVAEDKKLFHREFVPAGVFFAVTITGQDLDDEEAGILLHALEAFNGQGSDRKRLTLGASTGDGWGRLSWTLADAVRIDPSDVEKWLGDGNGGVWVVIPGTSRKEVLKAWSPQVAVACRNRILIDLKLLFEGPFLVNDPSKTKKNGEDDDRPNHAPLRDPQGRAFLPAESFRGALRNQAERILRTIGGGQAACSGTPAPDGLKPCKTIYRIEDVSKKLCPACRVFGAPGWSSPFEISDFTGTAESQDFFQDFVAIDRFTGGAADGAKFDAQAAYRPVLRGTLSVDLQSLEKAGIVPWTLGLLALSLRDLLEGEVILGFGAGKGYGRCTGRATLGGRDLAENWAALFPENVGKVDDEWVKPLWNMVEMWVAKPSAALEAGIAQKEQGMSAHQGKLVIQQTKRGNKVMLSRETKNGWKNFPVPPGELSKDLGNWIGPEDQAVEFELDSGQIKRVRAAGMSWVSPTVSALEPARPESSLQEGGRKDAAHSTAHGNKQVDPPATLPGFHNPYNFVPALLRENLTGEMGDRTPMPHDRYVLGHYSGHVKVSMTTETPLLLPDTGPGRVGENAEGHKIFEVLIRDGKPYIQPSSMRGMLRAAYESATNSRYGVFVGHEQRLGLRMPASGGLGLIPARVQGGRLMLLAGSEPLQGGPPDHMRAAWLPAYTAGSSAPRADRILVAPDNVLPEHGQEVWCQLQKVRRWVLREDRRKGTGEYRPLFTYWRVIVAASNPEELRPAPDPTVDHAPSYALGQRNRQSYHQRLSDTLGPVKGWICMTNQNIGSKHDERVFFSAEVNPPPLPLTDALRRQWRELIQDYKNIHKGDLEKRARRGEAPWEFLGRNPGLTSWSRHVYREEVAELRDGDLCYVAVESSGSGWVAKDLYPVMISRSLHPATPAELVPASLLPPCGFTELSPADRVFGWVRQQGTGAYRGNISIGEVKCLDLDAVDQFDQGLPLAILGQPKPNQTRFYVGKDKAGSPQNDGLSKINARYDRPRTKGLRGRKVYPHHRGLPPQYWNEPLEDRTQEQRHGHFQEYRRPQKPLTQGIDSHEEHLGQEQRDDQNRSVKGWVKPKKRFVFDLTFTNLSKVELGALLWLLDQPPGRFHRLGGGKPLGFGSVRLEIGGLNARTGELMRDKYQNLRGAPSSAISDPKPFIDEYKEAVTDSYGAGEPFDQVPFIAAFSRAMEGFSDGLPIHYPRIRQPDQLADKPVPPHPDGLGYEWFVENERESKGPRLSLRDLATDPGLPYLWKR